MFMRQKFFAHLCFSPGKAPGKYLWKAAPSAAYLTLRWGRDEQKKLWWRCWSERKRGCSCSLGDLPSRCVAHVFPQYSNHTARLGFYVLSIAVTPLCLTRAWALSNRPKVRGCQAEVPTELKTLEDLATRSNWSEVQAARVTGRMHARRRAGLASHGAERSDWGSVLTVSGSYMICWNWNLGSDVSLKLFC